MIVASDILIYQMGKVGSTSVHHALNAHGVRAIHAHWMCNDFQDQEFPTHKPALVEAIQNNTAPPMKVISLVREPVGRSISAYFQKIQDYSENYRKKSLEELQSDLINKYTVEYPDLWFEHELMHVFKFDPFAKPFDHERGYSIYKAGKHKLLMLRLENAQDCLAEALWKFLGVKNISMMDKNMFKQRHNGTFLGARYREFESSKYPRWFVDKNYNLRYAKHFYTADEISKFVEIWNI